LVLESCFECVACEIQASLKYTLPQNETSKCNRLKIKGFGFVGSSKSFKKHEKLVNNKQNM
jgi:hypothetical protein